MRVQITPKPTPFHHLTTPINPATGSARSSLESNGWGVDGSGAGAGGGRRGSLDLGRLAAALRRRLSGVR